jgi:hypothetical protein
MKIRHILLPALLLAVPTFAIAEGASSYAPGQQRHKVGAPGQSEYAPGHLKRTAKPTQKSAKHFAPGQRMKHPTTTGSVGRSSY